jgi:hypothetical protein
LNDENAIRFLNAIRAFKKDIIDSDSKYPLISGLREIFKNINSLDRIQKNPLKKLLKRRILPKLNRGKVRKFSLNNENDILDFIKCRLGKLEFKENKLVQYFQFEWETTLQSKSNHADSISYDNLQVRLDLPI